MSGDDVELGRIAAEIEAASVDARKYRAKDFWTAYPKQSQFFATGRFRERGLFAGTQLGKTECAAYELACHLVGEYPPDWPGRRLDRAVKAWCVGENLKMTRDIMQKKLCGEPGSVEAHGAGMIPKDAFAAQPTSARGEANAYDTVQVRHRNGGISTLQFRTYQAGQMALQGESIDIVWCDEEPSDYAVYSELLARTSATGGFLMITFTPLKGMSQISSRFREEWSPERTYVQFGIDDIPADGHIPPERRAAIIAGYPEHEREARSRGEPMLGEGKIYRTPESEIVEDRDPTTFPTYWRWGWAIDLGIGHPFAACLLAHMSTPSAHVSAMRQIETRLFGRHMDFVVAYPHDAGTRDRGSGDAMIKIYKQYGLRVMAEHATHANIKGVAAISLEGGIQEINEREKAGKWKVSRSCVCYLEERRTYHRKDGEPVSIKDDALAAARYGMMARRHFKTLDESGGLIGGPWVPTWNNSGSNRRGNQGSQMASGAIGGLDWDLFTGQPR